MTARQRGALVLVLVLVVAREGRAQTPAAAAGAYTPITNAERGKWIVDGSIGPRSLATGVFTSSLLTATNSPREWERSWEGFGKRFGTREANVTISNGIEGGLGALWGEDPRYGRVGTGGVWPRVRHVLAAGVLARRGDGRMAPAWARYAGVAAGLEVTSRWMPPRATSAGGTTWRISGAVLGRIAGNAFTEFWPDVRERLRR